MINYVRDDSCTLKAGDQVDVFHIHSLFDWDAISHIYHAHDMLLDIPVFLHEFYPADLIESRNENGLQAKDDQAFQQSLADFAKTSRQLARVSTSCGEKILRYFEHGNTAYFVTDYFPGQALQDVIVEEGQINEHQLVEHFTPILQSLHKYHGADVIHADLRPGKIWIRDHLDPLLRGFAERHTNLLQADSYTAPECLEGEISERSDIYSLGALMYFCLSGLQVLSAKERQDAIKQGKPDPQPSAVLLEDVIASPRLLTVIDHCLDLRPERRPDSAALLLDSFRESKGVRIEGSVSVKHKAQELSQRDTVEVKTGAFIEKDSVSKIVITGTAGAGKSQMIDQLSDEVFIPPMTESVNNSAQQNTRIDQGCVYLPKGERLFLYGLPGPLGFDESWELVQQGAIGIILLLDNTRKDPQRDLVHFLSRLDMETCPPLIIGMTNSESFRTPSIRDINATIDSYADRFRQRPVVFSIDPAKPKQSWQLIEALLTMQLTPVQESLQAVV